MTIARPTKALTFALIVAGCLLGPRLPSAAQESPLDPTHMTAAQKEFWGSKVSRMDPAGDGRVTEDGFTKYYADLWDKNVPAGKDAVPVKYLAEKWAAMESRSPLDPEYKTPVWREEHVASMDVDHDGTVSRDEFLKHMKGHWDAALKLANAQTLTHDQATEMIANPLDPRYHAH